MQTNEIELTSQTVYLNPTMAALLPSEMNVIKAHFFNCIKEVCPNFEINNSNRKVIGDIFNWCIRNKNGALDPTKGLWIYGNVGVGKSTLMRAVINFIRQYWLRDSGEKMNPQWENVPCFCGKYASVGFSAFDSIPMGLDEIGTELSPTNHMGNKLNVVSHIITTIYDNRSDLPHITTSNISLSSALEAYGARAIDRIGQLFNLVEIKGQTNRPSEEIWSRIKFEEANR